MSCESCGHENRTDSRFCAGCGASLPRTCDTCGRDLVVDARFCDSCGAPVALPAESPAPTIEAVRKTVTALFCDLMGSTAFGEKVDAESVREAMGRYHTMAKSVIQANGGTVAKFIGDGVMALFGVPEVAEDDAERAVRTGLDLQAEFLEIHSHIADRNGVDLGLRVGINTGEVVIADDDNDVVGDALNTAARLEAGTDGLSRDQLIRMIQNLKSEPGDEVRLLVSEIHAASDLGLVMSEDFVTLDAEGWDVSRGGVSMIVFGDGVMVGAERWDDTDLAAALARFDEVHAEAGLPPSDRFSDPAKALEAGAVEPPLTQLAARA